MAITTTGSIYYFKDDLGLPLIGGKVYTYEYNTSKPKDTYKTGARVTPHKNPIILDDTGSVEWYLIDDYTIRVFDADDVFIEEQDIVAPTKVRIDQLSDSFDLLKSELKDAAYKEVGIEPEKIPLNSNLGTAAYQNVTKDANGFLRDAASTKEALVVDSNSNIKVSTIEAGAGAPKIAYKYVTGTTRDPSGSSLTAIVGLDFNVSKVLSCNVLVQKTNGEWVHENINLVDANIYFNFTLKGTDLMVTTYPNISRLVGGRPFKALITYQP